MAWHVKEIKKYIESLGHIYSGYDVIRQSCVNDSREHSITQYETLKSRYSTKPEFYTNKTTFLMNQFYNSCWNGKIAITSTGNILPCIFARNQILGNIKTNALAELKNEIIKSWEITKDDIEICKDCEFRYCCHDCPMPQPRPYRNQDMSSWLPQSGTHLQNDRICPHDSDR